MTAMEFYEVRTESCAGVRSMGAAKWLASSQSGPLRSGLVRLVGRGTGALSKRDREGRSGPPVGRSLLTAESRPFGLLFLDGPASSRNLFNALLGIMAIFAR